MIENINMDNINKDYTIDQEGLAKFAKATVSTSLNFSDLFGALKVRLGINRDNYKIEPGIYRVGNPNSESDVLVSANYKLSFDVLRKNLEGLNIWILVIDTKGVNVWCAAGKGNFGTNNVIKSIVENSLSILVTHRRIILPQLSASGVAAHKVRKFTDFKPIFGPVQARDIKSFIELGYKATPKMRKIEFPMKERAKLIPVDFLYEKYKLLIIMAVFFLLSGLGREGYMVSKLISTSLFPMLSIFGGYFFGIVISTLMLPYIPFRPFALKGAFWGLLLSVILNLFFEVNYLETISMGLVSISLSSFMAANFTGSSTFTSQSGVMKEMKWALPFQIGFMFLGFVLFIISKFI